MNRIVFAIFVCSLFLLAACGQKNASTEQSIQDIVSKQKAFNTTPSVTKSVETKTEPKKNATKEVVEEEPVEVIGEIPAFNKKCRYSTILYGGCKWTDDLNTNFILKIMNGGKRTIPGLWFIYTGNNGTTKMVRRNEEILSGGIRSFNIDYSKLVKDIGVVKKMEIYPIEVSNGTYACENMRVYTIPESYCKLASAIRVNEDGSVNQTG
ncbi:MAG: hypothetical protein AABW88_00630 [Nanoarchaeota archaeon]